MFETMKKKFSSLVLNNLKEVDLNEKGGSSSSSQITNSNLKNFLIKHIGWASESDDFTGPENSLVEVQSAINTDSYIKASLDKVAQLIMKSSYRLEGKKEAVSYVKTRLALMEFGTNIPFNVLLTEIARSLVYYSNCFLVKSRIDKIQGGLEAKAVLGKKPVGGYFLMDPTSVEIKRDNQGKITKYKLTGSEEKEFVAEDVIHLYIDRNAGDNFGTPRIMAALEDVKVLRKVEGHTLSLIYRFSIPLYQCQIGLPETNMMATTQEIKEAEKMINKMPLDGIIVTNERTAFHAIGAENKAIDLSTYLSYFEKRVFAALNVSEAMMGRGGSRQDSDTMEGLMHDTVKHYQAAMVSFLENFVINELLLEGGYNPILNEEDKVKFIFNEINIDTRIKQENHVLNQFQSNAITFSEMRQSISRSNEVDENELYSSKITTPNQIKIINAKLNVSNETDDGNQRNGKTASIEPNGSVKSVANPTNQNGTTSVKVKEGEAAWHARMQESNLQKNLQKSPQKAAVNNFSTPERRQRVLNFRLQHDNLYKTYKNISNDIIAGKRLSAAFKKECVNSLTKEFDETLLKYLRLGYVKSQLSGTGIDPMPQTIDIPEELKEGVDRHVKGLIDEINKLLQDGDRNAADCCDLAEYRLRFAADYFSNKAFNYAQLKGYQKQGVKKVKLKLSGNHSKEKSVINTDNFNIKSIPPFVPYCRCEIIEPEVNS